MPIFTFSVTLLDLFWCGFFLTGTHTYIHTYCLTQTNNNNALCDPGVRNTLPTTAAVIPTQLQLTFQSSLLALQYEAEKKNTFLLDKFGLPFTFELNPLYVLQWFVILIHCKHLSSHYRNFCLCYKIQS